MENKNTFDVIIIGGSYAGLSAAMSLGRSLRKVLIIDNAHPCNEQTPHSHNFITHDGETPLAIAEKARKEIYAYKTVGFFNGFANQIKNNDGVFEIQTQENEIFQAKKIILATGLKDIMPNIKGFADCWGISILHCPYCHGYEVRNEKTAILANGDVAFHYAPLISNLTKNLTIFTNGKSSLSEDQTQKILRNNVQIIETEIDFLNHKNGYLDNLALKDGSKFKVKAIYSKPNFTQNINFGKDFLLELNEQGLINTNMFRETSINGIYACGDNSGFRSVANAVATGSLTGASVNLKLCEEEFNKV